jgi:hypothetical protein
MSVTLKDPKRNRAQHPDITMSHELAFATAKNESERSDAIVVSFNHNWYEKIKKGSFSAIIRKRVPMSTEPKWLYFHVNSPISAICARAPIRSIRRVSRQSAQAHAGRLNMSELQVSDYIGTQDTVGLYEIGPVELASKIIAASKLATVLRYYAPQSFFILSSIAKAMIDQMGGFSDPKRTRD